MAYLAALSSSAMDIFIRTKGNVPPLDFRKLASLYTVQLFTSKLQASLVSCSTAGSKVIWKQYCQDNFNLVLVTSDVSSSDSQLRYLLDLIFNAIVLMVGLHLIEDTASSETLKRELKCAYPLIDLIFQGDHTLMSPSTGLVDIVVPESTSALSKLLDGFTEAAKSSYGCLTADGRVCVATGSWWALSPVETSLLSLLLYSLPPASCYDIPVYLPKVSSKRPHRLVIFTLYGGVHVSILCNPDPPLSVLQQLLHSHWAPRASALQGLVSASPRFLLADVSIDSSVLAFCLLNSATKRCLTSIKPSEEQSSAAALTAGYHGEMKLEKKLSNLRRFYKTVVGEVFPSMASDSDSSADDLASSPLFRKIPHKILETYICFKHYKGYAMRRDKYALFVIFSSSTPTFTLKKFTTNLCDTLTRTKLTTAI